MVQRIPILSAAYLGKLDRNTPDASEDRQVGHVGNGVGTEERPERLRISRRRGSAKHKRDAKVVDEHDAAGDGSWVSGPRQAADTLTNSTNNTPASSSRPSTTMGLKTHTWISAWFLLTAPIIAWDVGYCFMRPRSMEGGDLHWIWEPYSIYQRVDLVYGIPALEEGDGFTNAQSLLNVIETIMNVLYVYLAHVKAWPPAPLVGLVAASMTLSKTVLYWMQEYYCNYCAVGHNTLYDLLVYWIIPNGFWLIVPTFIIIRLGKDLAAELNFAAKASAVAKSK